MVLDNLDQEAKEAKKGSVYVFPILVEAVLSNFAIVGSRVASLDISPAPLSPYRSKSELCATMDPRDYNHDHNLILTRLDVRVRVGGSGVKVGVGVGRLRDYQGRLRDFLQNSTFSIDIDIVPSSL